MPGSLGKLACLPHVLVPAGLQKLLYLGGGDTVQLVQHTRLEGKSAQSRLATYVKHCVPTCLGKSYLCCAIIIDAIFISGFLIFSDTPLMNVFIS